MERTAYHKNYYQNNKTKLNKYANEYRKQTRAEAREYQQNYYHSELGKLKRIYISMKKTSKERGHEAPAFSKEEFINWAYQNNYKQLFKNWVDSDYKQDLSPSPDRLDNSKGYSFDNLRLVTWNENNIAGFKTNFTIFQSKPKKNVKIIYKSGRIVTYDSVLSTINGEEFTGTFRRICNDKYNYTRIWLDKNEIFEVYVNGDKIKE